MKKIKKLEETKFKNFILFPERLSNLLLVVIVILISVCTISLSIFAMPKPNYDYEPEYEEVKYYEYMNPYLRIISNYSTSDEKLIKKDNVIMCFYGQKSSNYSTKIKGQYIYYTKDGTKVYNGDISGTTGSSYSTTDYVCNSEQISGDGIKTFYGKVYYTPVISSVNQPEKVEMFKESMFTLNKKEINKDVCNEISAYKDLISNFKVTLENKTTYNLFSSKIELNGEFDSSFHIDYQLFAIDDDNNAHELIGYYNLSNNYSKQFSHSSQMPLTESIVYVIAKLKVITEDNGEKIYYYKQAVKNL